MIKPAFVGLSIGVLASSNAFAEGKTRAQVYQRRIERRRQLMHASMRPASSLSKSRTSSLNELRVLIPCTFRFNLSRNHVNRSA
jgi:hypothetical protein